MSATDTGHWLATLHPDAQLHLPDGHPEGTPDESALSPRRSANALAMALSTATRGTRTDSKFVDNGGAVRGLRIALAENRARRPLSTRQRTTIINQHQKKRNAEKDYADLLE